MQKTKVWLSVLLIVAIMSVAFTTAAKDISAKDLVLTRLKNFDFWGASYMADKVRGNVNCRLSKLEGKDIPAVILALQNGTLEFDYAFDLPGEKAKFNFKATAKGKTYQGTSIIDKNTIIFDRLFMSTMLQIANANAEIPANIQYLYTREPGPVFGNQLLSIYKQQTPLVTNKLAVFLAEAIPEKYFSYSSGQVILELDQQAWEDTIYNLLVKVKNEKERFAEIITDLALTGSSQSMGSPAQIKQEIMTGIEQSDFATREKVEELSKYVDIYFRYQAAIVPGGEKTFAGSIEFLPASGFTGSFTARGTSSGKDDDFRGRQKFTLDITGQDGRTFTGSLDVEFECQDKKYSSDTAVTAALLDANGAAEFGLGLNISSSQRPDPALEISIPELTPENSVNFEQFSGMSPPEEKVETTLPPREEGILIYVDNKIVAADARPFIQNSRTMVPIRFVAEALNCQVKWSAPNKITITGNGSEIIMYTGEKKYVLNGTEKQMDTAPVTKDGRTFVPIRFVAEALNTDIKWVKPNKIFIESGQTFNLLGTLPPPIPYLF